MCIGDRKDEINYNETRLLFFQAPKAIYVAVILFQKKIILIYIIV